jgi:hypothetical protein
MRSVPILLLCTIAACANDYRSETEQSGSARGVDGGLEMVDGGSSTSAQDARVPPPDGIPPGLAPCDEAPYHSDFGFIEDNVLSVSCLDGCHSGADPAADMNLSPGVAYTSLVNIASHHPGWQRVVPNDSGASMLMVQVGGEPGVELEGFMPWGQPRLCDPLVDVMRRWINAGAAPR